jgi:uncharacterized damage-inducible protein DinB
MHAQLVPLGEIFALNRRLLVNALEDVPPADAVRRIEGTGNSLLWIAGHAVKSRGDLAQVVGAAIQPYWPELFARGALPRAAAAYPALAAILKAWEDVSAALVPRFEALGEADLARSAPFKLPVADQTVLGTIAFLALHESYHVGQLGYIRRLLGCETLAG